MIYTTTFVKERRERIPRIIISPGTRAIFMNVREVAEVAEVAEVTERGSYLRGEKRYSYVLCRPTAAVVK